MQDNAKMGISFFYYTLYRFVAIYAHIQLVDFKYVFFIEGNPNPCVTNWIFMGQVSYMLFKYAYCEKPYFLDPYDYNSCMRCHPHCKHCIGYKIN